MVRLPIPGADDGTWGDILNEYLSVEHTSNGTHAANLDSVARTTVRRNTGSNVGSRRRLNLIEGANVALTVTDDPVDEEIDVVISSSAPTPTFLVAANNANAKVKAAADWVCDGTEDQVQINAAIDAASALGGGRVLLSEGLFLIGRTGGTSSVPVNGWPIILKSNITLVGSGWGTVLKMAPYQYKSGTNPTASPIPNIPNGTEGVPNVITTYDWTAMGANVNITIADLKIDGNKAEQTGTNIGTEYDCLNLTCTDFFSVSNILVINAKAEAFDIDSCRNGIFSDSIASGCDGSGFHLSSGGTFNSVQIKPVDASSEFMQVVNCQTINCGYSSNRPGFLGTGDSTTGKANIYVGCVSVNDYIGFQLGVGEAPALAVGCAAYGSSLQGFIGAAKRTIFSGCIANSCQREGFKATSDYAVFEGCLALDNGKGLVSGARSGIHIQNAKFCAVTGNIAYDSLAGASRTQDYGILEDGTANNNLISANNVSNNATGQIATVGAATVVRGNAGYVTEINGTATVTSGQTTITVTHGLSVTPALDDIHVTPTNSLGNATKFWISNPTGTQFTINVNTDPGATTATFAWNVQIL